MTMKYDDIEAIASLITDISDGDGLLPEAKKLGPHRLEPKWEPWKHTLKAHTPSIHTSDLIPYEISSPGMISEARSNFKTVSGVPIVQARLSDLRPKIPNGIVETREMREAAAIPAFGETGRTIEL